MTRTKSAPWSLRGGDMFGVYVARAGVRVVSITDTMGNTYIKGARNTWHAIACHDAAAGTVKVTVTFDGPASSFEILGPNDAD